MGCRFISSGPLVLLVVIVLVLSGCAGLVLPEIEDDTITETAVSTPSSDETDYQTTSGKITPTTTETATATQISIVNTTSTATETPTSTPTATETPTSTPTATETPTSTPTATETSTATPTATETSTATPTATETSTSTPTTTETSTSTPTTTETSTSTPTPATLITVAIKDGGGSTSQRISEIRTALAYWEQNSEQYVGQPVEFRLVPNTENPDILLSYVSHIDRCGDRTKRIAGCTRVRGSQQVRIQIVTHYTDKSTVLILKHEFGHALGLRHNDAPSEIMSVPLEIYSPNATDRDFTWDHSTLTVAIDLSTIPSDERATVKQEIMEVLAYYNNGAGGTVPESVTFRLVSNSEKADITIRTSPTSPCSGIDPEVGGSCHRLFGEQYDSDQPLEIYRHLEIVLTNLRTGRTKVHVGFQLGFAFGFDELSDWPEQFRPQTVD